MRLLYKKMLFKKTSWLLQNLIEYFTAEDGYFTAVYRRLNQRNITV